jgi:magnesium transporter
MDAESAAEAGRSGDTKIWLDLQTTDAGELEMWLDRLGVAGLPRRLCLEARDRAAFYPLKDALLLVIPLTGGMDDSRRSGYLLFFCRDDFLLTVHDGRIFSEAQLDELRSDDSWLPERSIAGLVSAILITISLASLKYAAKMRDLVFSLVEQMDRNPDDLKTGEIMDLRSELMAMGTVINDQLPYIESLRASTKKFFDLRQAGAYMDCALVNLKSVDGALDWLDQSVGNLLSGLNMHSQEKTNRRLNMLTILSAIFSPLSLLAGIWGMNFVVMPELGLRYAYPAALALMAFIGTGMYLFFRRRGWFD